MAYAYSDGSHKRNPKVHFESDPVNRCCSSSSCYTSSSCSSSSRSSMEEPYDIDKADFDSSPETNQPDLIEEAPLPSPEVSPKTIVPQIPTLSERPSGHEPNRLPPAMFAAKPSSAMEWSVASNESLFSIHAGNSSFSKDQYSSELGKLDEMVETLETDRHSVETESDISEENNFHINIVTGNVEKDEETKETVRLPTIEETKGSPFSRRSDESNHSNQSFRFSVLAGHHDHHASRDYVRDTLEQVKEEKQEIMRVPEKQQYLPEKSPEKNAPLIKATKSCSWLSCFCCCCICR